jgi:hypothetical protein
VHEDSAGDRVFVIDDSSSVVEVGVGGKVSARHRLELPQPDDTAITFLRTATDGAGNRYFVGSKLGAQQVHLFDAGWKRIVSFPEFGNHPGIADAILADLQGEGQLKMFVGYVAAVGVHCVDLDGERLWRNPAVDNVLRLGVTGPDRLGRRQLLAAEGLVLPIDADGMERPPIGLSDTFVRLIFTADLDGDENREWCAIAMKSLGPRGFSSDMAVGLSPRGGEFWRYPLPAGMQKHVALEMVVAGDLLSGEFGQWVIAGADGSIHLLDIEGNLIDRFNYGAALSGMAIADLDGRPALLVATDESVEAWQFDAPDQDQASR